MNENRHEDPMQKYQDYLSRYTRNSTMTLWQAHQLLLSRLVAEEYGLSQEEIAGLDENL